MADMAKDRALWPAVGLVALLAVFVGSRMSLADPASRALAVVLVLAGGLVVVGVPGVATLALVSRRTTRVSARFGLALAGSGTVAFVDFWAWVATPNLGRAFGFAAFFLGLVTITVLSPRALLDDRELAPPLLLGVLVALAFTGLAYSQGGLGGVFTVQGQQVGNPVIANAYRYWLAPDNTLPFLFAERLAAHGSLRVPLSGNWLTSDRPPLETGFVLELFPLLRDSALGYQLLGTALQATWVPALWLLLRSRIHSERRVALVVIATACTGAMFVNTIYVWPKMLAGTFVLAALFLCLDDGSLVLIAVLVTLGLLSHGGIALSVLALVPFALRLRLTKRGVSLAAGAAAALYLPWVVYQRFIAPPGNRLLKYQLAGIGPPDRNSFLSDLTRQYTDQSVLSVFGNKLFNVENLFAPWKWWHSYAADPEWFGWVGDLRVASITSLFWTAGPMVLGLLGLATARVRAALRQTGPLFGFVVLSIALWALLLFGGELGISTLLVTGPYAAIVVFIALAALATSYLWRPLAFSFFGASVLWFVIAWVPGLGFHDAQPDIATPTDWGMVALMIVSVCAMGILVARIGRTSAGTPRMPQSTPERLRFNPTR